jgi:hypothetical protein
MKRLSLVALCLLVIAPARAAKLTMPEPPVVELEVGDIELPLPRSAGLLVTQKTREEVYVVQTSPFDKIHYPIGVYTADLFAANLPQVFSQVAEVGQPESPDQDVVVQVEIVRFEAKIPHPAYNPYTATVVYKITARDQSGEVLLVQTVTGDGQTSKGMMSGFKAKKMAAQAASLAMADALKQALEALAEAPELGEAEAQE